MIDYNTICQTCKYGLHKNIINEEVVFMGFLMCPVTQGTKKNVKECLNYTKYNERCDVSYE